MSRIITVHGTNASGPLEGDKWWQKGAVFERHLHELIEGDDGSLQFDPFVWDGLNSETSRRAAGAALYTKLREAEADGTPYFLIGHSHGGSVISSALLDAAAEGHKLPNLKLWLTVATPFIEHRRRFFRFARLNTFGKAIYLIWLLLLTAVLGVLLWIISQVVLHSPQPESEIIPQLVAFILGVGAIIPLVLFHFLLRRLDKGRGHISKNVRNSARADFAGRWFALWHGDDEAMRGLMSLKNVRANLFTKDFAVEPLSSLAIFAVPLILLLCFAFEPVRNLFAPITSLAETVFNASTSIKVPEFLRGLSPIPEAAYFMALILAVLSLLSLAAVYGVKLIAGALSFVLSGVMNRQVSSQLRRKGFGDDHLGEFSVDAGSAPAWAGKEFKPLPDELGDDIAEFANRNALEAIVRFRASVTALAAAEQAHDPAAYIANTLTWKELLHTSYFELPRFRKLIAYAVAETEGFRPTPAFQSDADFDGVARLFQAVRSSVESGPAAT